MTDIFKTSGDRSAVPSGDTAAQDAIAEPIVIRKLDRLETTHVQSNPSGA
jgi:hypothetical protein